MRFTVRFIFVTVFLCGLIFTETGCVKSTPSLSREKPQSGSSTVFDHPSEPPLSMEPVFEDVLSPTANSDSESTMPRPTLGEFLGIKETVSVRSILDQMDSAYRNALTYRDLGEITLQWKRNGIVHTRRTTYRTSFKRPNGLLLEVGQTQLLANGKLFCAYTAEMPGLILQKPCPAKLSLFDLLSEREIYWALTEVESGRFCAIPLPLLFLVSPEPITDFLEGGPQNPPPQLDLLESRKIGENECFRLSLQKNGEETIFWVDANTFVLRRVELPKQVLNKDEKVPQKYEEMAVTLDFHEAEFNWVGVLEMNIPENAVPVSSFIEPQIKILGTRFPNCRFTNPNPKDSAPRDFQGKILFCFFWSIYSPNAFKSQDLNRLYNQFKDVPNLVFLGVNIDPPEVSDEKVLATASRFGLACPLARNSDETITQTFRNGVMFSCFLVDANGVIQFCDGFNSFHPKTRYARKIQDVLAGKEIYPDLIREIQEHEEAFQNSIRQWIENGIFLRDANSSSISLSEKKILPPSEPVLCEKKTLWFNSEIKSPTWIEPFPQRNSVLVLENGIGVAEVDLNGKVLTRHELELPQNEFLTKIQIFTSEKPYFALLGKRLYVYDSDWKRVMVYPPESQGTLKNVLSDAILADADEDGKPEIYVTFQNENQIRKLALDGKEFQKNETDFNVLQFAIARIQGKKGLLVVDQSGRISVFNPQNLERTQMWEIPQRTLNSLVVRNSEGESFMTATAISPSGKVRAVGISEEGKEIWNIDLPDFLYQRNIQKVQSFFILNQNVLQTGWVLLGADASIFLVGQDGLLMDQFQFGKIITGCASAVFDGKAVLFIASPDGVSAMEFLM